MHNALRAASVSFLLRTNIIETPCVVLEIRTENRPHARPNAVDRLAARPKRLARSPESLVMSCLYLSTACLYRLFANTGCLPIQAAGLVQTWVIRACQQAVSKLTAQRRHEL